MDRKQIKKRLFFWYSLLWAFLLIALYLAYCVYFVDMHSTKSKWVGLFSGAIALLFAACKVCEISYLSNIHDFIRKVSFYFTDGVKDFLKHRNKVFYVLCIIFAVVFLKFVGLQFTVCFVTGFITSDISYAVALVAASKVNSKIYCMSNNYTNPIIKLALSSSIITSMVSIGLPIIFIVILYHCFKDYQMIVAFALGASLISLLNNSSVSISKNSVKSADNVASTFFAEIKNNDKRNPLLLLEGISNAILPSGVLTCDIISAFLIAIVACMCTGADCLDLMGSFLPIIIASSGIFASIITVLILRVNIVKNLVYSLFAANLFAVILFCVISCFVIKTWINEFFAFAGSICLGAILGWVSCFVNSSHIYSKYKPQRNLASAAIAGSPLSIIYTFKEGLLGIFNPLIVIAVLFFGSYFISYGYSEPAFGIFGISLAVLGYLSVSGILILNNIFAYSINSIEDISSTYEEEPIEPSGEKVTILQNIAYYINSLCGNYTYIGTILASISAFIAYTLVCMIIEVDVLDIYILSSVFIGCASSLLYCGMITGGIFKTSGRLVLEVKRQFRKFPQILRGEMRPDFIKCVDIASLNSSLQTIFYLIPVFILFFLSLYIGGVKSVLGFVFGSIATSFVILFILSNASNVASGAVKYFEQEYGANYSQEYMSLIENESIYLFLKDTISPCLVGLVKFFAIFALSFIPLLNI